MREDGQGNSFPASLKGEAWKLCAQECEPKVTKISEVFLDFSPGERAAKRRIRVARRRERKDAY